MYGRTDTNWWLQPDAARSTYLEILSISGSTVTVSGDATGLAQGLTPNPTPGLDPILGNFYTIVWPAGVDPGTGTLAHNNPCEPISRLLFASYYYMPPVAGTMIQPPSGGTGPHGQQPGNNHHGDYYCWNRVYAQKNGVWTTPDPESGAWINLEVYASTGPLGFTDPSGLQRAGGSVFGKKPKRSGNERFEDWDVTDDAKSTTYESKKHRCTGKWRFRRYDVGTWDAGKRADGSIRRDFGLVVDLAFTLQAGCECDCKEVRLVQAARTTETQNGVVTFFPSRRTDGSAIVTNDGWKIDQSSSSSNKSYYGSGANDTSRSGTRTLRGDSEVLSGTTGRHAWLKDWPGTSLRNLGSLEEYKFEAITCAICASGDDEGVSYSCVSWGYVAFPDGAGGVSFSRSLKKS